VAVGIYLVTRPAAAPIGYGAADSTKA